MNLNWGLVNGDICDVPCDAVVNAANTTLLGGGGVDGAIHRAAGPELRRYIEANVPVIGADDIDPSEMKRCEYGMAVVTPSFGMSNCKAIIHTVGPIWRGGGRGEIRTLMKCYTSCLDAALDHGFRSVAFPSVSTGCYRFPTMYAMEFASTAVRTWLVNHSNAVKVVFVGYNDETYDCYYEMMKNRSK